MDDPLLRDAMEGFDAVDGDHEKVLHRLERRIARRTAPSRNRIIMWSSAAALLICAGTATLLLWNERDSSVVVAEHIVGVEMEDTARIVAQEYHPAEEPKAQLHEMARFTSPVAPSGSDVVEELMAQKEMQDVTVGRKPIDASEEQEVAFIAENAKMASDRSADSAVEMKEEVVVVGYGAQGKRSVTGSVSHAAPEPAAAAKEIAAEEVPDFNTYVTRNLRPQADATGEVVVRFNTDGEGRPVKMNVIKNLTPAADAEARRLVESYPHWPANQKRRQARITF